jgi:hypothetical protein
VIYGRYLNEIAVAPGEMLVCSAARESLNVDVDAALDWVPLRKAKA